MNRINLIGTGTLLRLFSTKTNQIKLFSKEKTKPLQNNTIKQPPKPFPIQLSSNSATDNLESVINKHLYIDFSTLKPPLGVP